MRYPDTIDVKVFPAGEGPSTPASLIGYGDFGAALSSGALARGFRTIVRLQVRYQHAAHLIENAGLAFSFG
jgi:hypothetical protein